MVLKKKLILLILCVFTFSIFNLSVLGKTKYSEKEIFVKFKDGEIEKLKKNDNMHDKIASKVKKNYSKTKGLQLIKLSDNVSVEEALKYYKSKKEVLYAEPNIVFSLSSYNNLNSDSNIETEYLSKENSITDFLSKNNTPLKKNTDYSLKVNSLINKENNAFAKASKTFTEVEPNNYFIDADTIDENYTGIMDYSVFGGITNYYYDMDYYRIDLSVSGTLNLFGVWSGKYFGYGMEDELLIGLYDSNGNLVHAAALYEYGLSKAREMNYFAQPGTYYIGVFQSSKYQYLFIGENYGISIKFDPLLNLYPSFDNNWAHNNFGQAIGGVFGKNDADIDTVDSWNIETGKSDVVIAVIDSGVDYNHPDLKTNLWKSPTGSYGRNFVDNNDDPMDDNGHGTAVAGIIAADGTNNIGIKGVMWQADIMALKVFDINGNAYLDDLIEAIYYANNNGAKIINISSGSNTYSQVYKDVLSQSNALIVTAAGNSGTNNDVLPFYPASFNLDNLISVAATDNRDTITSWSNYGMFSVDIAAPGKDILSTRLGGGYVFNDGTSFSAPYVSGVAGLLLSKHPFLNRVDLKKIILKNSDKLSNLNNYVISGRLNSKIELSEYNGNINSELKSIEIGKNSIGNYLYGSIVVVEWINGLSTVPTIKPIMRMKSTDGETEKELFVTPTGTNTYYFDGFIDGIDTTKEYYIEIESGNEGNVSEYKIMNIRINHSKTLGDITRDDRVKYLSDSGQLKVVFEKIDRTYVGNINSELKSIEIGKNSIGNYLYGSIVVVEWINGLSTVPTIKPIMRMKSTDGETEKELFVTPTGTNTYYFDGFIDGIDTTKEYYIEIESGNEDNVSEYKNMNIRINHSKTLGIINGTNLEIINPGAVLRVKFITII